MSPIISIPSIPLHIHFLEIARGECNCSPEIQEEIFTKGVLAMRSVWLKEGGEA
jgi:hypothetical protein